MENSQNFKTEELFETFNTEDIHTNPTTELSEQVLDTSSFGFQTQHAQSQDNNFIPFPVITGSNAQGLSQNGAQDFKQEPRSGIRIADFAIDPDSCAIIDQAQDSISTPREQENPTQPPPPVSANSRVYVLNSSAANSLFNSTQTTVNPQSIARAFPNVAVPVQNQNVRISIKFIQHYPQSLKRYRVTSSAGTGFFLIITSHAFNKFKLFIPDILSPSFTAKILRGELVGQAMIDFSLPHLNKIIRMPFIQNENDFCQNLFSFKPMVVKQEDVLLFGQKFQSRYAKDLFPYFQ